MKQKTLILYLAAFILMVGAVWYFGSPSYAMSQLRDAAIEGNRDDLEERIDFPKVRESLKSQLSTLMAAELAKSENQESGFGALGAMVGMAMIGPMIDGLVTPDSMAAMIQQGNIQRSEQQPEAPQKQPVDWEIERSGLDRFTATPKMPEGERVATMVFERNGLSWKLTGVDLPEGGLDNN